MIVARILPNNKDGVREIEIFELDRPFADADHFAECQPRRFMTHVRTIRQIVGAELATNN